MPDLLEPASGAVVTIQESRQLLPDEPDPALDILVGLAIKVTGARIGGISIIHDSTIRLKSLVGVDRGVDQPYPNLFFSATAAASAPVFEIPDVAADDRFAAHPFVIGASRMRHYAGCRLTVGGGVLFGVLWVMHTRARALSEQQSDGLQLMARQVADLLALGYRDHTTGLPNRAAFLRHLQASIDRDGPGEVTVGFIDLQGFRLFKNIFGAKTSDHVLQLMGARLCAWAGARDVVAHVTGDKFTFALFGDIAGQTARLQQLRSLISAPFTLEHIAGHVLHARIGIARDTATDTASAMSPRALLDAADLAAAACPAQPNTVIQEYAPRLLERADLATQLRGAIQDDPNCGTLVAYYQPQVDFAAGTVVGFEALVRWQHPTKGMFLPDIFVPLAESAGIINLLDLKMLDTVCTDLGNWRAGGLSPAPVSLNFSRGTLVHGGTLRRVEAALENHGLNATQLELEITESRLLEDLPEARSRVAALRALGMRVAIDDFGTGYSNLDALTSFPFDRLKVDRRFVHGVARNPHTAGLLRLIQGIAKLFDADLLCEGVEDERDILWLREMGITRVQGWYFSRARPAADIVAFLHVLRERQKLAPLIDFHELRRLLAPAAPPPEPNAAGQASTATPFQNATRPAISAAAALGAS